MGDTFTVKVKIVDDDSNTIHYGRTSEEMVALLNTINPDNLDKLEVCREGSFEETKAEILAWARGESKSVDELETEVDARWAKARYNEFLDSVKQAKSDEVLPKTIERWCCPGKSCGNTELSLITVPGFEAGRYATLYEYVRTSNGEVYSDWKTKEEMVRWLEETKDHIQEEMDPDLAEVEKDTPLRIVGQGKSGIFRLDSLRDEAIRKIKEEPGD